MNPKVTKDEQFVDHRFEDYTKKYGILIMIG
jgi:hypothetical protein